MEPTTVTTPPAPPVPAPSMDETIAKAVAAALKPVVDALGKKVTDNAPGGEPQPVEIRGELPTDTDRPIIGQVQMPKGQKGLAMAACVRAIAASGLRLSQGKGMHSPLSILQEWGKKSSRHADIAKQFEAHQKSFIASSLTDGGSFVPEVFAAEVIELLRNNTVMRKAGYRTVPLEQDNLTMGRQTGAATAAYASEGAVISTSKPSSDQVKLSAKKLTSIVPISNDLIRIASISADDFVRADLLEVMALREDLAFLRGDGTQDTPKGIRNDMNAANAYAATAVLPKAPTLQEVRLELAKIRYQLKKNNVPGDGLVWVTGPRTEFYLTQLQDGNGNPAIFAKDIASGTLWGLPFYATTQVPENLGGGDESELYLYRSSEFMVGDALSMELTIVPNGTYEEGGVTKSGLSRDETPVRVLSKHDCKLRHNVSAACVTVLRWGAP